MDDLTTERPGPVPPPATHGWRHSDWAPVSPVRTYQLVLERIETQIISGAMHAGDRLPPERELAEMLAVSRPAVREALRVLEAQGVVRAQSGRGPGSGTAIEAVPGDALTRLLRLHVALGSFPLEDVIETRVTLETSTAALACLKARPRDLTRIWAAIEAMDEPEIDRELFNELDTEFHVGLAEAGGNRLMSDMTRAIRESVKAEILATMNDLSETGTHNWPSVRRGLRADHHAIFAAVEAHEAGQAAQLLETHIRGFALYMTTAG